MKTIQLACSLCTRRLRQLCRAAIISLASSLWKFIELLVLYHVVKVSMNAHKGKSITSDFLSYILKVLLDNLTLDYQLLWAFYTHAILLKEYFTLFKGKPIFLKKILCNHSSSSVNSKSLIIAVISKYTSGNQVVVFIVQ